MGVKRSELDWLVGETQNLRPTVARTALSALAAWLGCDDCERWLDKAFDFIAVLRGGDAPMRLHDTP